jgi:precorrin-6A synthase
VRTLSAIGIGAGDPEQLTLQAVRALNAVEVFFVPDKGEQAPDLARMRHEICERHIERPGYRIVEIPDPPRDRGAAGYREAVHDWRRRRGERWEQAITSHLGEDGHGGFLVWGDPSLYDSTLAILEQLQIPFALEVIPGISSVQALTARHRIALNRVGGAVQITTGRRLAAHGLPAGAGDVVVMLDADCAFRALVDRDIDIYWGAYLGTPHELLIAGPLREVASEIVERRAQARAARGWIMDTYLLRLYGDGLEPRPRPSGGGGSARSRVLGP